MNDGELRILEYVKGIVEGLRTDLGNFRDEAREHRTIMRDQFEAFQRSASAKFTVIFDRLLPLEIATGIEAKIDLKEEIERERQQTEKANQENRKHGVAVARLLFIGAIIGGVASRLLDLVISLFHWIAVHLISPHT